MPTGARRANSHSLTRARTGPEGSLPSAMRALSRWRWAPERSWRSRSLSWSRPVGRVGWGEVYLFAEALGQELEQLVLVAHMPVEGRGAGAEFPSDALHRQRLRAVAIEHAEGGIDDRVATERCAWRGAVPGRHAPGRLWQALAGGSRAGRLGLR